MVGLGRGKVDVTKREEERQEKKQGKSVWVKKATLPTWW